MMKRVSKKVAQRWASSHLPSEPVEFYWERGEGSVGFHTVREAPGEPLPSTHEFPGENPGEGSIYDVEFVDDMLKHQTGPEPVDVTDWSNFQINYNIPHVPQEWRR